jgi:hypothetical protein
MKIAPSVRSLKLSWQIYSLSGGKIPSGDRESPDGIFDVEGDGFIILQEVPPLVQLPIRDCCF